MKFPKKCPVAFQWLGEIEGLQFKEKFLQIPMISFRGLGPLSRWTGAVPFCRLRAKEPKTSSAFKIKALSSVDLGGVKLGIHLPDVCNDTRQIVCAMLIGFVWL